MDSLPKKLKSKLETRRQEHTLRQLAPPTHLIDFSSNDYLGFSKSESVFNQTHDLLKDQNYLQNGATGSRLLTGNHPLYVNLESLLCDFHHSEAALVFNSGYDANLGFFSSVPQHGDLILYDEWIHASIRDGIQLSNAKAYKFKHNDLGNLEKKLKRADFEQVYVATESIFSMDGDSPNLIALSQLSQGYNALLIVDEAHAIGVLGKKGKGLVQHLGLQDQIFARLVTFGKALGSHGAAILGNNQLKRYLVNFSRSLIYSTALPPHNLATSISAYSELQKTTAIEKLERNIQFFTSEIKNNRLQARFIESDSAIHCCIVPGNDKVKHVAKQIQNHGFDVKPILSPTVPKGQERLRFCIHSYNSEEEISEVLQLLATFVN